MRMPSSLVRRATVYAITPYRPMEASRSASAPKPLETDAMMRSFTSDSSICAAKLLKSEMRSFESMASTCVRTWAASSAGLAAVRIATVMPQPEPWIWKHET